MVGFCVKCFIVEFLLCVGVVVLVGLFRGIVWVMVVGVIMVVGLMFMNCSDWILKFNNWLLLFRFNVVGDIGLVIWNLIWIIGILLIICML